MPLPKVREIRPEETIARRADSMERNSGESDRDGRALHYVQRRSKRYANQRFSPELLTHAFPLTHSKE